MSILTFYTSYEGFNLANRISRKLGVFTGSWREVNLANWISWKLGVFDRKLEGRHFIFLCYFDIIS